MPLVVLKGRERNGVNLLEVPKYVEKLPNFMTVPRQSDGGRIFVR